MGWALTRLPQVQETTRTTAANLNDFIKVKVVISSSQYGLNLGTLHGFTQDQFLPEQGNELFTIHNDMYASCYQEQVGNGAMKFPLGMTETRQVCQKTDNRNHKRDHRNCGHNILCIQIFQENPLDHAPVLNDMNEYECGKNQGGDTVYGPPGKILAEIPKSSAIMMAPLFHIGSEKTGNHTSNGEEVN